MHTPGPWNIQNKGNLYLGKSARVEVVKEAKKIVRMPDLSETSYDNARLIAAAPDLLEACKDAFASSCRRSETRRKWTMLDQKTHELLKKVIAKAEGGVSS